ncbi:molybdopterin-guanine dinucleotide biosynthesis protein B [Desulfosarcina sp. OttesenSCG-928-G10]|nr:molybdopterin-guanine dinucleotide biosynthesis protein B [Desulfosarcina sp. OttesenSCG-928-G10]MDL2321296.1 molybdopterin-guanine dinucleotide biosynthesis protein B [Desulfosarcina sp. OttesenSCG-928-B08]
MPPVVSIVGKSESGKTTLIEKLIPVLKSRGLRIGVVKHAHHGFDLDQKGKDSERHQAAGAEVVMVASPDRIAMVRKMENPRLSDLIPFFGDVDLLISEGFKTDKAPKIEIFRPERHARPACLGDDTLVAMVSDAAIDPGVPLFSTADIQAIANFVIARFLPGRQG